MNAISDSDHGAHGHAPNRFAVVPTSERVPDDSGLTGRGVTIAFLDSGFYPHPDLTCPENRILHYHDVHDPEARLDSEAPPDADAWHGTQTCVVAAGSGHLSDGVYCGLAPHANLVLVRVGRGGRISEADIERGLSWVLANQERFGIRVVSMSLGGDDDRPLAESRVNQLAEEAVRRGMVLVAAAGNSGCTQRHRVLPPATAPSVVAVGGYDDGNDPQRRKLALYCSSFGRTADGLVKPELIDAATSVAIADDFNDWNPEPMQRVGDGAWRTSRPIPPPGQHRYKLIVDGRRWIADPGNGLREPDPYGGSNSILVVKPDTPSRIG